MGHGSCSPQHTCRYPRTFSPTCCSTRRLRTFQKFVCGESVSTYSYSSSCRAIELEEGCRAGSLIAAIASLVMHPRLSRPIH